MQIITGKYKLRKVQIGDDARSTKRLVRNAIFNILGDNVKGARVLDLFAGSGILAIEALSRGAESAIINDINPENIAIARQNFERICPAESVIFKSFDARRLRVKFDEIDIVFSDPPYGANGLTRSVIGNIRRRKTEEKQVIFVAECDKEGMDELNPYFPDEEVRRYGNSYLKIIII